MPDLSKINIRDVSVSFASTSNAPPLTVLDHVSLDVQKGEFICIVGPSGCGKTTLLKAVAGLVRPTSGEIAVNGRRIDGPGTDRAVACRHRRVGFDGEVLFLDLGGTEEEALDLRRANHERRAARVGRPPHDRGAGDEQGHHEEDPRGQPSHELHVTLRDR